MNSRTFDINSPELLNATNPGIARIREDGWFRIPKAGEEDIMLLDAKRTDSVGGSFEVEGEAFTNSPEFAELEVEKREYFASSLYRSHQEETIRLQTERRELEKELWGEDDVSEERQAEIKKTIKHLDPQIAELMSYEKELEKAALKLFIKRTLFSKKAEEELTETEEALFNDLYALWHQSATGGTIKGAMMTSAQGFVTEDPTAQAIMEINSISTIRCEKSTAVKYEDGHIYVDTTLFDIKYIYEYYYKKGNERPTEKGEIPLPGTVSSRFVLIPGRGLRLLTATPTNSLLQDLTFETSVDVKKRMEDVTQLEKLKDEVGDNQKDLAEFDRQIAATKEQKQKLLEKLHKELAELNDKVAHETPLFQQEVRRLERKLLVIELNYQNTDIATLKERLIELRRLSDKVDEELENILTNVEKDCEGYLKYLTLVIDREDPDFDKDSNIGEVDGILFDDETGTLRFPIKTSLEKRAEKISDTVVQAIKEKKYNLSEPIQIGALSDACVDAYLKYNAVNAMQSTLRRIDMSRVEKLRAVTRLHQKYSPFIERVRTDSIAMEFLKNIAVKLGIWKTKGAQLTSNLAVTIFGNNKRKIRDENGQPDERKKPKNH